MFTQEGHPFACVRVSATTTAAEWRRVVRICQQITPLIEAHHQQRLLLLALGGCEHLLLSSEGGQTSLRGLHDMERDWQRLRAAIIRRMAEIVPSGDDLGLAVGLGPTRTLARLAALLVADGGVAVGHNSLSLPSLSPVVLPGQKQPSLAPLPVAILQQVPDAASIASLAEIVAALEASGVQTLGQLWRIPAEALARRFGSAGAQLAILAAGGDLRPLRCKVAEQWLGARLLLEPSLAAQQLPLALAPLAEKLALSLAGRELAAGKVALLLESETGKRLQVARRLGHPLGTTRALRAVAERLLAGLLAPVAMLSDASAVLDGFTVPDVELPAAGERYVTLRLRLGGLHPATAEQRRLWAAEQRQASAERAEKLAAAIRALKGGRHADALLRADLVAPDAVLPEERYRMIPRSPER